MERDPESKKDGYLSVSYKQALEDGLLPVYDGEFFMQDNAPIHRSKATHAWLNSNGVALLEEWLPYSPDLNPIEHL